MQSTTMDYPPTQRFPPRKVIRRPVGTARFWLSISATSVAIELDQSLVTDPEMMRNLMEHDVPGLAA
ncbi:MAG: hypothetical protein QOJ62_38 [Actinomycetota bacterium]|jgi:hypothetical protein|nr:hypothetical protein [Actinomycetota bacterium]